MIDDDPVELPMQRRAPLIAVVLVVVAGAGAMTAWALGQEGMLDFGALERRLAPGTEMGADTGDESTPERVWNPISPGPIVTGATAVPEQSSAVAATSPGTADSDATATASALQQELHRVRRAEEPATSEGDPPGYISAEIVLPRK